MFDEETLDMLKESHSNGNRTNNEHMLTIQRNLMKEVISNER